MRCACEASGMPPGSSPGPLLHDTCARLRRAGEAFGQIPRVRTLQFGCAALGMRPGLSPNLLPLDDRAPSRRADATFGQIPRARIVRPDCAAFGLPPGSSPDPLPLDNREGSRRAFAAFGQIAGTVDVGRWRTRLARLTAEEAAGEPPACRIPLRRSSSDKWPGKVCWTEEPSGSLGRFSYSFNAVSIGHRASRGRRARQRARRNSYLRPDGITARGRSVGRRGSVRPSPYPSPHLTARRRPGPPPGRPRCALPPLPALRRDRGR